MRIGIVAPSAPILPAAAEAVARIAADAAPGAELVFHPQCFLSHNHFAGDDRTRLEAFVAVANDPGFDALWFARGGYGSCRIAEEAVGALGPAARDKAYLGYSDAGFVLAGLYRAGFPDLAHGPMPNDLGREGGEAAVRRALAWLTERSADSLEPGLGAAPALAFNLTVFGHLIGTALEPDLAGHEILLEEISEHMYRTDRALFHVTASEAMRRSAGLRLGRFSEVLANDPEFGADEEDLFRFWCGRAGIPYLGRADIGHDVDNKVVPFGSG
jgi:muramoyltetrapeptide carboxypeptidase